jgi:hypothetical protein
VSEPQLLLEASDVARALGLSYSGAMLAVARGDLHPCAITPRKLRLFRPEDVAALRLARTGGDRCSCGMLLSDPEHNPQTCAEHARQKGAPRG